MRVDFDELRQSVLREGLFVSGVHGSGALENMHRIAIPSEVVVEPAELVSLLPFAANHRQALAQLASVLAVWCPY